MEIDNTQIKLIFCRYPRLGNLANVDLTKDPRKIPRDCQTWYVQLGRITAEGCAFFYNSANLAWNYLDTWKE